MENTIKQYREMATSDSVFGQIADLFQITETKECLVKTREVVVTIKQRTDLSNSQLVIKSLSELFFTRSNSGSKVTVRRLLTSFFSKLSKDSQTFLSEIFHELIQNITQNTTFVDTSTQDVRQTVDILASLMENFNFGEECVRQDIIPYANYLAVAHNYFLELVDKASSPVELHEAMHHCLVTEQLINRFIQRCFCAIEGKLASSEDHVSLQAQCVISQLATSNVKILTNDIMIMDCRCNAGMTIILLLKLCFPDDLGELMVRMLGDGDNIVSIPDWFLSTGILNLTKSSLLSSSYLCFLFGSLSMLSPNDLAFEFHPQHFILIDMFLPETLRLATQVTNPANKVILAKLIYLWTEKAFLLTNGILKPALKDQLVGGTPVINSILDYIWIALDDSLDAVRQNGRLAFDQLLKTHLRLVENVDPTVDRFISNLIQDVLEIPWCKRRKYAPLTCLVGRVGTIRLLDVCPDLTKLIINQLEDHTLACYCSELYEKLYTSHKLELIPPVKTSHWYNIWVNPIMDGLCTEKQTTKNHILQYFLPKLMSFSCDMLQYMIEYLSRKDSQTKGTLGGLIMCLRRGRALGLLDDNKSNCKLWCGIVNVDVLQYALKSLDEQIRLDAYSLLCENKKTTRPIKGVEFELMKVFIPKNLNNQSPSFRQHVLAYTKKFFLRMKHSESSLIRQSEKSKNNEEKLVISESLENYQLFLVWLQNHLFSCLYPGAAFAMRTSCLRMLSTMMEVLQSRTTNGYSFSYFSSFTKANVNSIMECIADTFEDNKIEALKIFNGYLKYVASPVMEADHLKELFDTCMELAISTRPQDSTASAYLARCLLQIPGIETVMKDHHIDLKVLRVKNYSLHGDHEPSSSYLIFLNLLIFSLQDQTEVAKKGLIIAAANRPIYPSIHCIRYILRDVNLKVCSNSKAWKESFSRLIKVCLEVAEVVSPVVQDSSPEGNVPAEAIRRPGLDMNAVAQTDDDKKLMLEAEASEITVTLMPEYLVVCCWRSIKEISLLLGEISLKASIQDGGLLSFNQILEIGEYFITQLLQSKHRGAFELAYAGFVMMCERLWRHPSATMHQLPMAWLDKLLTDIANDDGNSGLCSTRRSAGIPFYVQALITTEPLPNEQRSFHKAMENLLGLAVRGKSPSTTNNPPRVHALNILKVLFKDNKLGDFVTPYISDGLIAAILGFKSEFWSVRNSSTLLLSSMMVRIFGVKVSKDDSDMSRKNCLTSRAFFVQFPKMYSFLLDEFKVATEDTASTRGIHLHPSLYPILMVLGRLFPSAMEGTDTDLNLAAFLPLVMRCASSPVYKTRVMSARAIQPLVEKDRLSIILVELCELLPLIIEADGSYNHIHGILLQIRFLLDSVMEQSPIFQEQVISTITEVLIDCTCLLSDGNRSPIAHEVAFEVYDRVLTILSDCKEEIKVCQLRTPFLQYLQDALDNPLMGQPGSAHCQCMIAKHALKYLGLNVSEQIPVPEANSVLRHLLQSPLYEVRLAVLDNMLDVLTTPSLTQCWLVSDQEILRLLLTTALSVEWHFECLGRVFEVLSYYPNCVESILKANFCIGDGSGVMSVVEIFNLCLQKLDFERRDSVKCSIIRFMSVFMSYLYNNGKADTISPLFDTWCQMLKEHSSTEQDADLQLASAQSILINAEILLVDPNNVLQILTFEFWKIAFDLLQEDDLDVKEVASKILSKLDSTFQGDVQPACALELLLNKFVEIHLHRHTEEAIRTLLILLQGEEGEEFEEDRLFDKGEMNTFRDEVFCLRLVTRSLKWVVRKVYDVDGSSLIHSDGNIVSHDQSNIQIIFTEVAQNLSDRLIKCNSWSASAPFKDSSLYSKTVTELTRSFLFLDCCDSYPNVLNSIVIRDLRDKTNSLVCSSCTNYCLVNVL